MSLAFLPKLPIKRNQTALQTLLKRDALNHRINRQEASSCENDELERLWELLESNSTSIQTTISLRNEITDQQEQETAEQRINFKEFCTIKAMLVKEGISTFTKFFTAELFLHFPKDISCRISIGIFYHYILRRLSLEQARIDLAKYDTDCDGFFTEQDLVAYITDMMPLLQLPNIAPSFKKFYVFRKFLFFLDKNRLGKISIASILLSPILTELFELRECELEAFEKSNWFSSHSTQRIYGQFLNLDKDQNGLLSRTEMSHYNNGTFSDIMLDRLFSECQTYKNEITGENELDYNGFLDFVLAVENNSTPEGITFFFKLLVYLFANRKDMHYVQYLDQFTLLIFIKSVIEKMISVGYDEIGREDLVNEIFDMASPKVPTRITLKDLISSGVGGTIISILSDVRGFWAYENRESLDNEDGDDHEEKQ